MEMRPIPAAFWGTLSPNEIHEVFTKGYLTRSLCRRLWVLEGRVDRPPKKMDVVIKRDEFERWMTSSAVKGH